MRSLTRTGSVSTTVSGSWWLHSCNRVSNRPIGVPKLSHVVSYQPIRVPYLGHVVGNQLIRVPYLGHVTGNQGSIFPDSVG